MRVYNMKKGEVLEKNGIKINIHTNKRIEYKKGDILGDNGIVFLEEVVPDTRLKNKKDTRLINFRKALFQCFCGNEFVCLIARIKSGHTKSCSCLRKNNGRTKK